MSLLIDPSPTNVLTYVQHLAYEYIRSLIHRPAVCACSDKADNASAASITLADSSKRVYQVLELLEERQLSFAFCLEKKDLLLACGFGLLTQSLSLDPRGILKVENNTLLSGLARMLRQPDFSRIVSSITADCASNPQRLLAHKASSSTGSMEQKVHKHMKAMASKISSAIRRPQSNTERRISAPARHGNESQHSLHNYGPEASTLRSEPATSPNNPSMSPDYKQYKVRPASVPTNTNLDYLSFMNDAVLAYPMPSGDLYRQVPAATHWDTWLFEGNASESLYDGEGVTSQATHSLDWSPESWAVADDFTNFPAATAKSVLSFSDESLTSGDEFADLAPSTSGVEESYRGILIPEFSPSLGSNFGL